MLYVEPACWCERMAVPGKRLSYYLRYHLAHLRQQLQPYLDSTLTECKMVKDVV